MATLSVPLPARLESFINTMVKRGRASTKAEVVRQALSWYSEEQETEELLRSMRNASEGDVVRGDLRTIVKRMAKEYAD